MKKFFEMMRGHETKRTCRECKEPAVAWIFRANQSGGADKSSREPVCRQHLAEERPSL